MLMLLLLMMLLLPKIRSRWDVLPTIGPALTLLGRPASVGRRMCRTVSSVAEKSWSLRLIELLLRLRCGGEHPLRGGQWPAEVIFISAEPLVLPGVRY